MPLTLSGILSTQNTSEFFCQDGLVDRILALNPVRREQRIQTRHHALLPFFPGTQDAQRTQRAHDGQREGWEAVWHLLGDGDGEETRPSDPLFANPGVLVCLTRASKYFLLPGKAWKGRQSTPQGISVRPEREIHTYS